MSTVERRAAPETLARMREIGGSWACYENQALDSASLGHLKFLKVGPGCTFEKAPRPTLPDTQTEINWRYQYVGVVDMETGLVEETK